MQREFARPRSNQWRFAAGTAQQSQPASASANVLGQQLAFGTGKPFGDAGPALQYTVQSMPGRPDGGVMIRGPIDRARCECGATPRLVM